MLTLLSDLVKWTPETGHCSICGRFLTPGPAGYVDVAPDTLPDCIAWCLTTWKDDSMKDLSNVAQLWATRTSAAVQQYVAGVNNVTVAPNSLAAKAQDAWLQGVQQAAASGVYQRANNAVSLQSWQQAATTKGGQRIPQGVTQAVPKVQAFWQKFGPVLQNNVAKVNAMPNTTLQDRIQKAVAMMTLNAQFSNK